MTSVFIPFNNWAIWVPLDIDDLFRQFFVEGPAVINRHLQKDFLDWAAINLPNGWTLEEAVLGMTFKFQDSKDATLFKLTWA